MCVRAVQFDDFLQLGRLRLRQISGPNAASSVVAAEARRRSWHPGDVSEFALRLPLRCQLPASSPTFLRNNRSKKCP